jgi:hypothetical protein
LVTALAVAAAIALASALVYVLVRDRLQDQVDDALSERAEMVTRGRLEVRRDPETGELRLDVPGPGRGRDFQGDVFMQAVNADGEIVRPDPDQVAFRSRTPRSRWRAPNGASSSRTPRSATPTFAC